MCTPLQKKNTKDERHSSKDLKLEVIWELILRIKINWDFRKIFITIKQIISNLSFKLNFCNNVDEFSILPCFFLFISAPKMCLICGELGNDIYTIFLPREAILIRKKIFKYFFSKNSSLFPRTVWIYKEQEIRGNYVELVPQLK